MGKRLKNGETLVDAFIANRIFHVGDASEYRAIYVSDARYDTIYNHIQDVGTYKTEQINMERRWSNQ